MKKIFVILLVLAVVGIGTVIALNLNNGEGQIADKETMEEDKMSSEMKDEKMDTDMKDDKMDSDMKDDDMSSDIKEETMMNDGNMAETFELMSLEGETVKLTDLKGEKVYVKFWASWCSICVSGLPELNELAGMTEDYEIITIVSPGYNGEKDKEAFMAWYEKQGYDNITVLLDEEGMVSKKYGVRGYPTSAFIGSDGVLVKTLPGHISKDMLTQIFDEIY